MFVLPCRMVVRRLICVRCIVPRFPNVFPLLLFPCRVSPQYFLLWSSWANFFIVFLRGLMISTSTTVSVFTIAATSALHELISRGTVLGLLAEWIEFNSWWCCCCQRSTASSCIGPWCDANCTTHKGCSAIQDTPAKIIVKWVLFHSVDHWWTCGPLPRLLDCQIKGRLRWSCYYLCR